MQRMDCGARQRPEKWVRLRLWLHIWSGNATWISGWQTASSLPATVVNDFTRFKGILQKFVLFIIWLIFFLPLKITPLKYTFFFIYNFFHPTPVIHKYIFPIEFALIRFHLSPFSISVTQYYFIFNTNFIRINCWKINNIHAFTNFRMRFKIVFSMSTGRTCVCEPPTDCAATSTTNDETSKSKSPFNDVWS